MTICNKIWEIATSAAVIKSESLMSFKRPVKPKTKPREGSKAQSDPNPWGLSGSSLLRRTTHWKCLLVFLCLSLLQNCTKTCIRLLCSCSNQDENDEPGMYHIVQWVVRYKCSYCRRLCWQDLVQGQYRTNDSHTVKFHDSQDWASVVLQVK